MADGEPFKSPKREGFKGDYPDDYEDKLASRRSSIQKKIDLERGAEKGLLDLDDEQFKTLKDAVAIVQNMKHDTLFRDATTRFIYETATSSLTVIVREEFHRRGERRRSGK